MDDVRLCLIAKQAVEKIDHLIFKQWQRLLEIQEIQTELMEELSERFPSGR